MGWGRWLNNGEEVGVEEELEVLLGADEASEGDNEEEAEEEELVGKADAHVSGQLANLVPTPKLGLEKRRALRSFKAFSPVDLKEEKTQKKSKLGW